MSNTKSITPLFSWVFLLLGWRRCQHCGNVYPRREMVKIRETGWYHHDHPIRFPIRFFPGERAAFGSDGSTDARGEEETQFLETLSRSQTTLKARLDAVTNLDAVPTTNQINALVQSINVFTHLEPQTAPDEYLILFLWQHLSTALERLHVETQVLRQECCKSNTPTRSLLEQQVSLKRAGEVVLTHLDELLGSLHNKGEDDEQEGT